MICGLSYLTELERFYCYTVQNAEHHALCEILRMAYYNFSLLFLGQFLCFIFCFKSGYRLLLYNTVVCYKNINYTSFAIFSLLFLAAAIY